VEAAGESVSVQLGLIPVPTLSSEGEPCAFLAPDGCRFPPDLMPIGCVSFLCPYMEEWYSPQQMGEMRAEVEAVQSAHAQLLAALLRGA
jgi:hypothetical protein